MIPGYLLSSPLGDIALRVEDDALTGVYFIGQKHYPGLVMMPTTSTCPESCGWRRSN